MQLTLLREESSMAQTSTASLSSHSAKSEAPVQQELDSTSSFLLFLWAPVSFFLTVLTLFVMRIH
jgi:hypothetical protein